MLKFLNKYIGAILFISTCIIALTTYKQYGISWDEGRQRQTGLVNYRYVVYGDQGLLNYSDRDYGVAFELPLILIEMALGLEHSRDIFLARHLLTHFFFLIRINIVDIQNAKYFITNYRWHPQDYTEIDKKNGILSR